MVGDRRGRRVYRKPRGAPRTQHRLRRRRTPRRHRTHAVWDTHKIRPEDMAGILHDVSNLLSPPDVLARQVGRHVPDSEEFDPLRTMASTSKDSIVRARRLLTEAQHFLLAGMEKPAKIDLADILRQNVAVAQMSVPQGNGQVEFNVSLADNLPPLMGRSGELDRVFNNLLVNALQAMPKGGTLSVESALNEQDSVVIKITDTGAGIAQHVLGRIFEPLYSTKGENGTGLGLATADRVIRAHNGTIEVKSEEGKGTTFEITLPTHS